MKPVAVVVLLVLLSAGPAQAITCPHWTRLTPEQKSAQIDSMIRSAMSSNTGRRYHVNMGRMSRCLESSARPIEYDFDDACARSTTAGMRALDNIFKKHVWSCVN